MIILQLDVDSISFEPIKPESNVYERVEKRKVSVSDAVVLLTSIEKGDNRELAAKAVKDALDFAKNNVKRGKIVIYPFAHLSNNLEAPSAAMKLMEYMVSEAKKDGSIEVYSAPFGWNKELKMDVRGHPLAEMSRRYRKAEEAAAKEVKAMERPIDLSIVRKSDFAGLPETDHRVIGERLNLFSFQEVSPGMVYWHKEGLIMYRQLTGFLREKLDKYGYDEVSTPALANLALWHVSGHIDHYKDNMFIFDSASERLGMKPMNCPSTIMIYKSKKWSYRELPFRTAIFDKLYRNEVSGALTGLFRVRELTQDDGHIFLREDQLEGEMQMLLKFVKEVYDTFGMSFAAKLSTMPDDHMGDEALWEKATSALKRSLESNGIPYKINEKDGAFYGPKIDFDVTDSMGRKWQCATLQIDYQLPLRFNLEYTDKDGQQRSPVMVHRAILGSLERFIGVLIEHFQGKFPTWIAPVQAIVIPISEKANGYAEEVYARLKKAGIRAEADTSDKTMVYKIREAQLRQVPYMLVIGQKEAEAKNVSVRGRSGAQKMGMKLEDFEKEIREEIKERRLSNFL